jgi:hypothetical protein
MPQAPRRQRSVRQAALDLIQTLDFDDSMNVETVPFGSRRPTANEGLRNMTPDFDDIDVGVNGALGSGASLESLDSTDSRH